MGQRRLEAADFESVMGTTFTVQVGDTEVPLELVKVDVKQGNRVDNAFSIEFAGPPDALLDQRIQSLQHETLGSLEIFLVPVAGDEEGFTYESVFTRLD